MYVLHVRRRYPQPQEPCPSILRERGSGNLANSELFWQYMTQITSQTDTPTGAKATGYIIVMYITRRTTLKSLSESVLGTLEATYAIYVTIVHSQAQAYKGRPT